jgi:methylated-DNA-[protein]-cysteine S-methyltransferase
MRLETDRFRSPIGDVFLVARGDVLCLLDFVDSEAGLARRLARRFGKEHLSAARDPRGLTSRLRDYFEGDLQSVDDIPVEFGGSPFQESVWRALRDIPAGSTETYGHLAARIGRPTASRAVGHANSQNPIAIVAPCHRVIGADGSLTGYAGGIHRKQWLLDHERGGSRLFARTAGQ